MNKTSDNNGKLRKRVALTLRQKIDICQLLEKGVSRNSIMKEYNVGSSTIYDIKGQKEHILKFIADSDSLRNIGNRKNLRKPKLEQVDSLLYEWYKVMRADGLPITGRTLMEKAKEFHQHLNPNEHCHFSGGWLARFKIRHGIRKSGDSDDFKIREGSDDEFESFTEERKVSDDESEVIFEDHKTADENPQVDPIPGNSRNQPQLPKLQPIPPEVSQDKSFPESSVYWRSPAQHSRISSQYSYPSHPPKLSGPSAAPSQPTFEDSTLSLFLSETRMQNAEMRVAMGQLTDKMDNVMNKINQLSQHRSVKWRQNAKVSQEDYGGEGDDWIGDENGHTITKSKLMARIISLEEKCEILEKENTSLKKDLEDATSKLVDFETNQFGKNTETVKTAMNSVYGDLETRFLNGVEYEGLNIRKTIASTIREVTEQLHEESIELDPCKRLKLGNLPALGKRKRKSNVKDVPADIIKVSQKASSSETVDVATSSSAHHQELEMDTENPDIEHEGGWKRSFEKPADFLESTMILQDGEVITVKEENCSIVSSREGSEERVIGVDPSSPPILDAGELSESGEEWLPSE